MRIEQIAHLASHFSRLEQFCHHPKEAADVRELLRKMRGLIERLTEGSSPKLRELLSDLHLRVSTWHQVWARLGREVDFRHAVGREAHTWSEKLLKLSKETKET